MTITLIGVNHQTAGVASRELLAVPPSCLRARLAAALSLPHVEEALLLSTCNRVELYLVNSEACAPAGAEALYADVLEVPAEVLEGATYVLSGAEAAGHLFRVAAGAESMVLGETEITGQLRQALEIARDCGAAGTVLCRLAETALALGKRARSETAIGRGPVSLASVAADLARQALEDLSRRRVLVLGAGQIGSLLARRMADSGARDITVISRTLSRARALAVEIGGAAAAPEQLARELQRADLLIACAASPHPLITVSALREARVAAPRPLLLLDLAVPRNVEPQVRELEGVRLHNLDDLQALSARAADQRSCELPVVAEMADREAREFMIRLQSQGVVPLALALREQAEAVREEEIALLREALPGLSRTADKAIHLMTKRLVRRLLQQPLERLRELSVDGLTPREQEMLAALFTAEGEGDGWGRGIGSNAGDRDGCRDGGLPPRPPSRDGRGEPRPG